MSIMRNQSALRTAVLLCVLTVFLFFSMGVYADELETEPSEVAQPSGVVYVLDGQTIAAVNDIAEILADVQNTSMFNPNSSQVLYLRTFLAKRPFCEYVLTWDGSNDYVLYFGYGQFTSGDYVRIYRTQSGNQYYYNVSEGHGNVPSGNIYVDTRGGDNGFAEIEQLKMETALCVAGVVALALWVLCKILFR